MAKGFDIFSLFMNDWWGSTARKMLSPAGRAAYWELLMTQYSMGSMGLSIIPCTIAACDETIAKNIGFTLDEWLGVKEEVLKHFDRTDDGGLSNPKVATEIAYRLSRVHGGKASAAQRAAQRAAQHSAQEKHNVQPSSSSSLRTPLPPSKGGPDSVPIKRENPRSLKTNPRAAAKQSKVDEAKRREQLIAALERHAGTQLSDGTVVERGGIYDSKHGTLTWDRVSTSRLEQIAKPLQLPDNGEASLE